MFKITYQFDELNIVDVVFFGFDQFFKNSPEISKSSQLVTGTMHYLVQIVATRLMLLLQVPINLIMIK